MRLTGKHTPLRYREITRWLGSGIGSGRPPHASAQSYLGDGKTITGIYRELILSRLRTCVRSCCLRCKQGCIQKLTSAGSPVPWYWASQANHCRHLRLLEIFRFYTHFDLSSCVTVRYIHWDTLPIWEGKCLLPKYSSQPAQLPALQP